MATSNRRQIRFGLAVPATGINKWSWRHSDAPPDASVNLGHYIQLAQQAEAAKLDFLFVADGVVVNRASPPHFLNRLEPLTALSAMAAVTSRIGLVATVATSFTDPYNVARQFASLDQLSGGRAGWNVVTGDVADAAANFTNASYLPHDERYRLADEFLAVVQGLWDSWEDGAFIYDKANNRFADTDRLHSLDHKGTYFNVKGPLALQRSPQGQPVIFQAGQSEIGRDFAAQHAGAVFSVGNSIDFAKSYYADVKRRARGFGRSGDAPLIFPGLGAVIGGTIEEAERKLRDLREQPTLEEAIAFLSPAFGNYDFSGHDPDAPFPLLDETGHNESRGYSDRVKQVAREEGLTLRETALRFADPQSRFVGTPETVADEVQRWFEEEAVDGFILGVTGEEEFTDFVQHVIPILRRRGLFREDYEHATLRGHLGLDVPPNRHTVARQQAAEPALAGAV